MPVNEASDARAYRAHMATAAASPTPPRRLALLRAWAWLMPFALLAIVIGLSIAGAETGSTISHVDLLPSGAAETAEPSRASVRCELRHGFAQRLAFTAQMMARSFVPGAQHVHAPAATCQVQRP
jgi:hypothetical protein